MESASQRNQPLKALLAAGLEVLMSMVAAGVLYAALVAGWLVTLPGILGLVPAVALGVLGGYLGDGVVHGLFSQW